MIHLNSHFWHDRKFQYHIHLDFTHVLSAFSLDGCVQAGKRGQKIRFKLTIYSSCCCWHCRICCFILPLSIWIRHKI